MTSLDARQLPSPRSRRRALGAAAAGLALSALAPLAAQAQQTAPDQGPIKSAGGKGSSTEVSGLVVNGVPYRETVLPTRLRNTSTYGLDLNVMDTPRNTTLLSTTQLETLNIEDPRAFSYLTSSSYTDSAFGTPNIPRIRGQYADVFYNGMRTSFSDNGYGAPINFDSFQNIAITKGPASVIDGPGPGVGGEVDLLTKRPSLSAFTTSVNASFDTVSNRRWTVDVGGPLIPDVLGALISYSGEDSGSYFYGHFMRKNAVYAAVRWRPNSSYQLDFNTEVNSEQYTENVGVNRVNQSLINNGLYLQGAPDGNECFSYFSLPCGMNGLQIGSPGNPYSPVAPILTETLLTNEVPLNPKVTLDETPGTSARALIVNAQIIQTLNLGGGLKLENNTFFNYLNSDNSDNYYFADNSNGSWTIENRLDVNGDFDVGPVRNQFIFGGSFRFAHVNYITNFSAEPASVYDLTSNPALWVFSPAYQALADAFPYTSVFGRLQYGVPARDATNGANTGISNLYDFSLFFQDRAEFSEQWSMLFGGRIDTLQDNTRDPLGGAVCGGCFTDLPAQHTTGVYGIGDVNTSLVWRPAPEASIYATFDWTQSENPNGGVGGINALTQVPDSVLLRADSYLYEVGTKLNLFNNRLFIGGAVFDQKHGVPTGQAGQKTDMANIRGVEVEANYQPNRNLFATASYSYIKTTLNDVPGFYDWPAQPGVNIDGGALIFNIYKPGQKVDQPGQPQHVFNFLGNYKFPIGIGVRAGVQVTGPIATTPSAWLDIPAMVAAWGPAVLNTVPSSVLAANGYYQSPVIPWQYTLNAAIFYQWSHYTITASVYNLTNQRNWQPSPSIYGNDFLVQNDPRTFEIRLQAKF
jgi:outer membrane receptor protein involved in Fe transport